MLPAIVADTRAAVSMLHDVARRAADPSPAWSDVADEVFAFQRRFWLLEYGAKVDKDRPRSGRNPRFMYESGGLKRSATLRGSEGQRVTTRPTYLLIEVTNGLGVIHEARGREVLGTPGVAEATEYAGHVSDYILTGRA